MTRENLDLTTPAWSADADLFTAILDQGIDAHLEAFTQSAFTIKDGRLFLSFHPDEVQILLRRLLTLEDDESDLWVEDILSSYYGVEGYE